MNRRDFIKSLAAIAGAAAIPSAFANSLPEIIPSDWYIALHEETPQTIGVEVSYKEYARVQVPRQSLGSWENSEAIIFPEATRNARLSKLSILTSDGVVIYECPLSCKLQVSAGITPIFPVGGLRITEE